MYIIVSQDSVHIFKTDLSVCFMNIKKKLTQKIKAFFHSKHFFMHTILSMIYSENSVTVINIAKECVRIIFTDKVY